MSAHFGTKEQILQFRLAELHEACTRLGLSKAGRKAALQARLLAYLGEADPTLDRRAVQPAQQQWRVEAAVRVVRDIYCRMKGIPNTSSDQSTADQFMFRNSAAQAQPAALARPIAAPANAHAPPAVQPPVPGGNHPARPLVAGPPPGAAFARVGTGVARGRLNTQIRCICQVQTERGQMIECENPTCSVWQHCDCLGLSADHIPRHFHCETCRAKLADPFWEPIEAALLPPSRLKPQAGRASFLTSQGMQEVQSAERVFFLTQAQIDPVAKNPNHYRLQVGCLEVHDEVGFRYHWPKHVDLRVNNMQYRPYTRAPNMKMGINQRDEAASIGSLCMRGRNTLTLSSADTGIWVLLLQLTRKRTINQVKAHMAPPEPLDEAVVRMRRLVAGGTDGSDEDDEDGIMISHQVVSLKDPMSGQRIKVPARFRDASGLQCFDLDTFLSMVERNRKWQDPTTLRNSTLPQLQIDTYMLRVLQCMQAATHITDIELAADGHWRPAGAEGPWFHIHQDPSSIIIQPATLIKPDPEAAAGGGGGDVLSSDEEDEEEELRQASRAVAAQGLAGQKRKEPEVIDLLESSDDERPPPAPQQQAPLAAAPPPGTTQPAPGPSVQHPLRIRLPIRMPPRPNPASTQQQQQEVVRSLPQQQQQPGHSLPQQQQPVNSLPQQQPAVVQQQQYQQPGVLQLAAGGHVGGMAPAVQQSRMSAQHAAGQPGGVPFPQVPGLHPQSVQLASMVYANQQALQQQQQRGMAMLPTATAPQQGVVGMPPQQHPNGGTQPQAFPGYDAAAPPAMFMPCPHGAAAVPVQAPYMQPGAAPPPMVYSYPGYAVHQAANGPVVMLPTAGFVPSSQLMPHTAVAPGQPALQQPPGMHPVQQQQPGTHHTPQPPPGAHLMQQPAPGAHSMQQRPPGTLPMPAHQQSAVHPMQQQPPGMPLVRQQPPGMPPVNQQQAPAAPPMQQQQAPGAPPVQQPAAAPAQQQPAASDDALDVFMQMLDQEGGQPFDINEYLND